MVVSEVEGLKILRACKKQESTHVLARRQCFDIDMRKARESEAWHVTQTHRNSMAIDITHLIHCSPMKSVIFFIASYLVSLS